MTDKAFEELIRLTADAYNQYLPLFEDAEAEYERRYRINPSDFGDDFWLDSLRPGCGKATAITVEDIERRGELLFGFKKLV